MRYQRIIGSLGRFFFRFIILFSIIRYYFALQLEIRKLSNANFVTGTDSQLNPEGEGADRWQ